MTRPTNPYRAGNPVSEEADFFGREKTLRWVAEELRNSHTDALVLSGQRRIGKTSLLHKLQRYLGKAHFFPVYFDLLDQAKYPLGEVLLELADAVARRLKLSYPNKDDFDNRGKFFINDFLPNAVSKLSRGARLVFLFDEFEVLDPTDRSGLDEGAAAVTLLPFLRKLLGTESRIAFVFVVGRTDDLSENTRNTFRSALQRKIWVLDDESANSLVRQAESNGTLRFTEDGVNRVLSLTNKHPYFTQLLCQRIWQAAYHQWSQRGMEKVPVIGAAEAEAAVGDALEAGDNALEYMWGGLTPAERIYAAAMGEIASEGEGVSDTRVVERVSRHAPGRRDLEVERAGKELVERQVLGESGEVGNGIYCFEIEIFRRWIRQQRTLRRVEDELDKLRPEAEIYVSQGKSIFHRKAWSAARDQFLKALEINPDHAEAHIMLGEVYSMQELREPAMKEMEIAFRVDPKRARIPYARTLARYAEHIALRDDREALAICDKAARINRDEESVRQVQASIWTRWGDNYFAEGKYAMAYHYYSEARDLKKMRIVDAHRSRHRGKIDDIFQGLLAATQEAKTAAELCERVAVVTADPQSRGIWLAACGIFLSEEDMLQQVASSVDRLKKLELKISSGKVTDVQRDELIIMDMIDRVKRVYRRDDWEALRGSEELFKDLDSQAISLSLLPNSLDEVVDPDPADIEKVVRVVRELGESLSRVIIDCRERDELERGIGTKFLWDGIVKNLRQKRSAMQTYVFGLNSLVCSNWPVAQKTFGWVADASRPAVRNAAKSQGTDGSSETPSSVLWQIESMRASGKLELWTEAPVTCLSFSPQGDRLGFASTGSVRCRNLQNSKLLYKIDNSHMACGAVFSADGKILAGAFGYGVVSLWWAEDGGFIRELSHEENLMAIGFMKGKLVTVATGGMMTIWEIETGKSQSISVGQRESIDCAKLSSNGAFAATASGRTVRLWLVDSGKLLRTLGEHEDDVTSVALPLKGAFLAVGLKNGAICIWDAGKRSILRKWRNFESAVKGLAFSPRGHIFASSSEDGKVRIWGTDQGNLFHEFDEPAARFTTPVFSPDGRTLAWGTWEDTVCLWNEATGIRKLGEE